MPRLLLSLYEIIYVTWFTSDLPEATGVRLRLPNSHALLGSGRPWIIPLSFVRHSVSLVEFSSSVCQWHMTHCCRGLAASLKDTVSSVHQTVHQHQQSVMLQQWIEWTTDKGTGPQSSRRPCVSVQQNDKSNVRPDLGVVPVMGLRVALYETKPVIMEKMVQIVINLHQ